MNSDNCPDEAELCFDETGSADNFCATIYGNQKCQKLQNPICKDYKPPASLNRSVTTPMDAPITIEAPSPGDAVISIQKSPKNGALSFPSTNTVTYTPNKGFVGMDEFVVEFCYKDSHCETMDVNVEVERPQSTAPPQENGTSKGLYALSALALIPLIIASVFVWKRYSSNRRGAVAVEPSNPSPDLPPTSPLDGPVPSPDPSAVCQTNAVIHMEVSTSVSDEASRQSSTGGTTLSTGGLSHSTGEVRKRLSPPGIEGYTLANKDQCRTHMGETREIPVADALPME
jgi:hypothetical protein